MFAYILVKEVFKRLITIILTSTDESNTSLKLSAVDVFVTLHKIEGADLKMAISAVNVCVAEEAVFNESVVAISITQMLDMKTLPTLIMRTVLQVRSVESVVQAQTLASIPTMV